MRISDWSSDVCSSDLGGKISSYRHVALHAVDELAAHVAALTGKRWTGRTPLPGGDFPVRGLAALIADIRLCHPFLPRATADRIARAYGTEARAWLGKAEGWDDLGGEIAHGLSAAEVERSEEHTSELQSLMRISYAVFCLKKKKKTNV